MSILTIAKVFKSEATIAKDSVLESIEGALKREFDKVKIKEGKDGTPIIHCRVKTKLWNPIVSLKGPVNIQTKENKAKVMVDADTKTNLWFWFTFLIGCFFWPLLLMMCFMYSSQKKKSVQSFEHVFERMDFDLGTF